MSATHNPPIVFSLILACAATPTPTALGRPAPGPHDRGTRTARADRALEKSLRDLARRGHRITGVLPLLRLPSLRPWVSPERYGRALRRARRLARHPLVADRLRWVRLEDALARGDGAAAARLRRELGLAARLWYVGPFEPKPGGSRSGRHGPELDPGRPALPRRAWVGKGQLVRWTPLPDRFPDGVLRPGDLVEAGADSVMFLRADVWAQRPGRAAVRLGSPCPYRLWLNGRLVASSTRRRPLRFDQDAVGITLRRGRNVLLLALDAKDSTPATIWRLSAPRGGPLRGVRYVSPERADPRGGRPGRGVAVFGGTSARPPTVPVAHPEPALRAATARRAPRAEALRDYLTYLLRVAPLDARDPLPRTLGRRLAAARPRGGSYRLLAAACADPDEARRALERAAAADPPDAEALIELAERATSLERYRAAEALLRRALAADPSHLRAHLARADLDRARRLPSRAYQRLRAVAARFGAQRPAVALALADLEIALGKRTEARRRLRALAQRDAADPSLRARLARLALRRGDLPAFGRHLRAQMRARPTWLRPRVTLAETLAEAGQGRAALNLLREALAWAPGRYALHRAIAQVALRVGTLGRARIALRKALSIRPQAVADRRLLNHLERRRPDPLRARWARDGASLARQAAERPPQENADAVVLSYTTAFEVLPSGLARRFVQQVVYIRTQRGANAWREVTEDYQPDSQELEIPVARVLRPGGEEVEARRFEVGMTDPAVRAFYDRRLAVMRFEDLRPGDVVEVQTLRSDVAADSAFRGAFGVIVPLQTAFPIRALRVAVSAPESLPLHANRPALRGLAFQDRRAGGRRLLLWTARQVPAVDPEPHAPGWADTYAHLHVSSFGTWDEVARWYWHLVREQLVPDEAIRRAARTAVRGKRSLRDKVLALYHLVIQKTRYVALAFGLHTYQPYPVSQVFARRFGDCKDKAALLSALLGVVGIDSRIALVRTRPRGRLGPAPPSLAAFDHAILYVPKLDLWLDATAERTGAGELPWTDQGVDALLVGPSGGRRVRTPVLPASANRVSRTLRVRLRADGSATVQETRTITGQRARLWRQQIPDPKGLQRSLQRSLAQRFPGVQITRVETSRADAFEAPVTLRLSYRVPRFARRLAPGRLVASLRLRPESLTAQWASRPTRKLDLVLDYPFTEILDVTVLGDSGLRLAQSPPALAERLRASAPGAAPAAQGRRPPDVAVRQQVRVAPGRLHLRRSLVVRRWRWPVSAYPRLRRLLGRADAAFSAPATWTVAVQRRPRPPVPTDRLAPPPARRAGGAR